MGGYAMNILTGFMCLLPASCAACLLPDENAIGRSHVVTVRYETARASSVEEAFAAWGVQHQVVRGNADIVVYDDPHLDPWGYTDRVQGGMMIKLSTRDCAKVGVVYGEPPQDWCSRISAHELGHAMGLGHIHEESVMGDTFEMLTDVTAADRLRLAAVR